MNSRKRKPTFVLIIPRFEDFSHSYFAGQIIHGVSLSASRLNADILVHIVDRSNHRGWLDSSLLDKRYIDGIIFADIDNDLGVVKNAITSGVPCMILNNLLDEPVNYVAVDNEKAGEDVVDYLVGLGHKKIATVAGDLNTQAGAKRLEGYRAALAKRRIELPKNYIAEGNFLRTPARQAAQKLLKLKDRPTAIFVASDVMALEVIDIARSMNIKVPEELSIVGFDDNPICSNSPVELTTVSQPLVEMGRVGAENLSLISIGKAKLPVKIKLPTKLIKRGSAVKL